ncbi:MAG TPA: histidine kinase [Puia sp.]|jgi:hypothetical protein|nr:histidine kinase [Puia sp.]
MRAFMDRLVYSKAWGYRVARHLLFWLIYFRLFRIMLYQGPDPSVYAAALGFLPFNAMFVYFAVYRLLPRYLMLSAYWPFFIRYCIALFACLTLDYYWGELVVYRFLAVAPYDHVTDFWHVMATILDPVQFAIVNMMAGIGVFIRTYKFWRAEVWMKLQISQEKTRAELELLKAQLQPQFLKNTLTHLHRLMSAGSDKAPQLLMRLSAILSYILYECRETEEVPLEREIAICKEYIALEAERHSHWLEISVDVFGSFAGKRIAPLALLPLIGSAFPEQAGIQKTQGWMAFEFSMEGDQLLLRVIDGTAPATALRPAGQDDSGMPGYYERLELLYSGRHWLSRKEREDDNILTLTLELGSGVSADPAAAGPEPASSLFQYAVFDY